jgi:hypothetical protein
VTCNCALTRTIRVARAVPVISSVTAVRAAGGINLTIIGFSTTRELTQATFQFAVKAGSNVPATSFTVPIAAAATTWFASTPSNQFGGQFSLPQPFTITGDPASVTGVTVTLSNSQGASQPVTIQIP